MIHSSLNHASLNPEQLDAVTAIEGPVMVVAGPGTGKTQILSQRIAHILKVTDASTENILCLTYTEAGTIAMKQRLLSIIGSEAHRISVHTFHGFCNRVIQENQDQFEHFNLQPLTDLERYQYLNQLALDLEEGHPLKKMKGNVGYLVQNLNRLFTWMKRENISPNLLSKMCEGYKQEIRVSDEFRYKKAYRDKPAGSLKEHLIEKEDQKADTLSAAGQLYPDYENRKLELGKYDFDDMILWVLDLFERNENVLSDYQELFQYILVDEYQDTSGSQNDLISKLVSFWDNPNLFVVGDDDQSIYRFQGAEIKNIVDFNNRYKQHLKHVVLKTNYRSTKNILDAAKNHIERNSNRLIDVLPGLEKNLTPAITDNIGSEVTFTQYKSAQLEYAGIAGKITELLSSGEDPNEIAVLYRQHKQGYPLAEALKNLHVPVVFQKNENILESSTITNLLDVLRFLGAELKHPFSGEYLLFAILHEDVFQLRPIDVARFSQYAFKKGIKWREALTDRKILADLQVGEDVRAHLFSAGQRLERLLKMTVEEPLVRLLQHIIDEFKLTEKFATKSFELECLRALLEFVESETSANPKMNIHGFLDQLELMEEYKIPILRHRLLFDDEGVQFMTAHGSKGLEFDHVFIIDCSEQAWEKERERSPYGFSKIFNLESKDNKDEHRRLFYVAMTRARKSLTISAHDHSIRGKDSLHSSFVDELLENGAIIASKAAANHDLAQKLLKLSVASPVIPDEHLLDQSRIRKYLENYQLSVSHLNDYLECPSAFYFNHILRVPKPRNKYVSFGVAVHKTLDHLFKLAIQDKDAYNTFAIGDTYERYLNRERHIFKDHEFADFLSLGKNVLTDFINIRKIEWLASKEIRSELTYDRIVINDVPVKGTMDLLLINDSSAEVVDFKTGNPKNAKSKLRPPQANASQEDSLQKRFGGTYWRQMVFYALLIEHDKFANFRMEKGLFDFIEPDDNQKLIREPIHIDNEGKQFMLNLISDVYQKIRNAEFINGCGSEDCDWCAFVAAYSNKSE